MNSLEVLIAYLYTQKAWFNVTNRWAYIWKSKEWRSKGASGDIKYTWVHILGSYQHTFL